MHLHTLAAIASWICHACIQPLFALLPKVFSRRPARHRLRVKLQVGGNWLRCEVEADTSPVATASAIPEHRPRIPHTRA